MTDTTLIKLYISTSDRKSGDSQLGRSHTIKNTMENDTVTLQYITLECTLILQSVTTYYNLILTRRETSS